MSVIQNHERQNIWFVYMSSVAIYQLLKLTFDFFMPYWKLQPQHLPFIHFMFGRMDLICTRLILTGHWTVHNILLRLICLESWSCMVRVHDVIAGISRVPSVSNNNCCRSNSTLQSDIFWMTLLIIWKVIFSRQGFRKSRYL